MSGVSKACGGSFRRAGVTAMDAATPIESFSKDPPGRDVLGLYVTQN